MSDVFTQLAPGALVLTAAAIAGGLLATRLRRGGTVAATTNRKDDLDERLGHLLAHLRDLDEQERRLAPGSYESERRRIEAAAAALMKERDRVEEVVVQPTPSTAQEGDAVIGFLAKNPQWKGALWGGGVVAVAAFLYMTVIAEQRPREAGGTMTGGSETGGAAPAGAGAQMDPEISALVAHLRASPSDLEALVRLGHLVLRGQMLDEARMLTDRALQLAPDNLEARVHDAVLIASRDPGAGLKKLDAVLEKAPELSEAWLFRGMLGMQSGNQELMRESFTQFVAHAPEGPQRERIRAMLQGGAQAQQQ
jgi:cytochrome c-type biogenesis protein CcmH/NrfG